MPSQKLKKAAYRLRGYECTFCKETTMVFGSGPEPVTCDNCPNVGVTPVKRWDHWNVESVEVVDYQGQDQPPTPPC